MGKLSELYLYGYQEALEKMGIEKVAVGDKSLINKQDLKDHKGIAAIIRDSKNRILMQKHNKWGFWTIPVGKIDEGDGVMSTLRKELKEETGISVLKGNRLGQKTSRYNRGGKPVKVTAYLYDIPGYSGKPKNLEPHKHSTQKFMPLSAIQKLKNVSDMTTFMLDKIGRSSN